MSSEALSALLLGASLAPGPIQSFALLAIETWGDDAPTPSKERRKPLTNAEKCARRRARKKGLIPPYRDTGTTPADTVDRVATPTPQAIASGVAVVSPGVAAASRDLEPDLSGSPLGSNGDLPQQPQITSDTATPPREAAVDTVIDTVDTSTQGDTANGSGTFKLVPSSTEKATKRATRAPSSVDPAAPAFCRMHGLPEPAPGSEVARFLDYWCTVPGQRGLSLDWPATWRNRPVGTRLAGSRGGPQTSREAGDPDWVETERRKAAP